MCSYDAVLFFARVKLAFDTQSNTAPDQDGSKLATCALTSPKSTAD